MCVCSATNTINGLLFIFLKLGLTETEAEPSKTKVIWHGWNEILWKITSKIIRDTVMNKNIRRIFDIQSKDRELPVKGMHIWR